jgi:metal-responsive CopG/Arc/MetJ family transcriptional regulator
MAKVMVSLPDEVLRTIDVEAERRGTTRSGLLRELAEEATRQRSMRRAQRMAEIDAARGHPVDRGGNVADVVKANRPGR